MFYKYFISVNDESYDTILAGKCQFAHPQNLDRLKKLILNDILKPIEDNCESGNIEASDAVSLKELTLKLYDHLYAHYYEMINGGVNEVSEPGVGSGSDRGKLVPKSGMEDGEKSCVYFCGARTANRHR